MVAHAQNLTHDLREMLGEWQDRIDHLQRMMAQLGPGARSCHSEVVQQMHVMVEEAGDLLSQSPSMTPEQWIDTRTAVLASVQTLQREYNTIVADWPQE